MNTSQVTARWVVVIAAGAALLGVLATMLFMKAGASGGGAAEGDAVVAMREGCEAGQKMYELATSDKDQAGEYRTSAERAFGQAAYLDSGWTEAQEAFRVYAQTFWAVPGTADAARRDDALVTINSACDRVGR